MLHDYPVIGFIPTHDFARARAFYVDLLGFEVTREDSFAIIVQSREVSIRIFHIGEFTPAAYTILGWIVPDTLEAVSDLVARGVVFERYAYLEQDDDAIWAAPGGGSVAWFKDPDGNTLSISHS
jgi:catechol 2,3-dioxygenase-like lactoylglutathione lyase family enzyme